jgi:hypothetical protein
LDAIGFGILHLSARIADQTELIAGALIGKDI